VVARVRELTGGRGVKVVYDSVGKDTWQRSLDCLAPLGLMVSFGNASGVVPPVNLLDLTSRGSLYVTRPTLGTHTATRELVEDGARDLFEVVTSGRVAVEIGRRYPLAEAAQAHRDLEARRTTGSSILTV
jgi:NADPH2:quinone reductase